ncbi:MAG TPA: Uma2 family endonuclease, partial [Polyangia bacterium]|nr:Uma2 family endonuclease [Polyangia bacterium]
GRLPADRLGLELGPWEGSYQGFPGSWLRWFHPDGELLPTSVEAHTAEVARREEAERQHAAEVARREEAERQRAAEAARREEAEERLRALETELAALRRHEPDSA